MNKFKMLKVFDCQDMPKDLKPKFFKFAHNDGAAGNNCYVDWFWNEGTEAKAYNKQAWRDRKEIDDWLLANGAVKNEAILIRCWW